MSCFCPWWLAASLLPELTLLWCQGCKYFKENISKHAVICFKKQMQFHWFEICYTEFYPSSFVSINEWLLHLDETLDKESCKSLVLCLGQMLSAVKYSAAFCPDDTLQFEHIHELAQSDPSIKFYRDRLAAGREENYLRWIVNVQCLLHNSVRLLTFHF